jgi:signal transduction histidine kinase
MRGRIRRVAILSTGVALVLFLLPLGYAVMNLSMADARAGVEAVALHAALTIDPAFSGSDRTEIPKATPGQELGLYGAAGTLVVGSGPRKADEAVTAALTRRSPAGIIGGSIVAVVPTTSAESITGVVRAALPLSTVWQRILLIWVAMTFAAGVALAVGVAAARSLSRRIVAPMEDLARASQALGDGDFAARTTTTGLAEIDRAGAAFNITAQRLNDAMARERQLTSHASHQLRTPLTGLRAVLENALTDPHADARDALRQGIERTDALEKTVDEIIALGRGTAEGTRINVASQLDETKRRWNGVLAERGRPIHVVVDSPHPFAVTAEATLRQVLDVLVDNTVRHGAGEVVMRVRDAHGAIAVDVEDAGSSIATGHDVFVKGFSTDGGTGLGLALARQLVTDHGGQLLLTSRAPRTRFTVILSAAPSEQNAFFEES